MENYHSDCDINLDCDCHHLGCDQLYALNGNRNRKSGRRKSYRHFFDKNLRRLWEVVLVPQIWLSLRPPIFNSTDAHRFFLFAFLSSHTDLAFPSAADFQFTDLTDFLPFYPLSSHTVLTDLTDFFTFLPFYPFTFKSLFYL